MEKEFTDRDYAKFLFDWLWRDIDDACAKCAYKPIHKTGLCRNVKFDINVCFEGIKQYAMKECKKYKK